MFGSGDRLDNAQRHADDMAATIKALRAENERLRVQLAAAQARECGLLDELYRLDPAADYSAPQDEAALRALLLEAVTCSRLNTGTDAEAIVGRVMGRTT